MDPPMNRSKVHQVGRPGYYARMIVAFFGAAIVFAVARPAPAGINVWTSDGPPGGGGSILAVVIDPNESRTVYAGTVNGGVFKSIDSGRTWSSVNSGLTDPWVGTLAIDPTNSSTVYAGTKTGVFKSTDGGGTWTAATAGPENVYALAVDPSAPTTLYAGNGSFQTGGVFKSTDGGNTWQATGLTNIGVSSLAIDPTTTDTLYAGVALCSFFEPRCSSGILKSTDGGQSWDAVPIGLPVSEPLSYLLTELAFDNSTPATLHAGMAICDTTPECHAVFYKSTDGGTTGSVTVLPGEEIDALAVALTSPPTLYAGTENDVFKSTDGGSTWNVSKANTRVFTIAIDPTTPTTLYAGTSSGAGVLKSTNGGVTWSAVGVINGSNNVRALAVDPGTSGTLYAATAGGVFKTTADEPGWSASLTGADMQALAINPVNSGTLYAGTPQQGVFKSTDAGGTWQSTGLSVPVVSLVLDPVTSDTIYAGTNCVAFPQTSCDSGVYKSTDAGDTWEATNADSGIVVSALAVDPVTSGTLYTLAESCPSSCRGRGCCSGSVFKSSDGGSSWNDLDTGLMDTFRALATDPKAPTTLYAGGASGTVFKSADGGDTWIAVGAPGASVSALAIDPTKATVYAGTTSGGVFKSTDGGATWSAFTSGLTNFGIFALAVDLIEPRRIYAGTHSGVFAIEQVEPSPTPTLTPTPTPTPTLTATATPGGGNDGCTVTPNQTGGAAWWLLVPALVLARAQRRRAERCR